MTLPPANNRARPTALTIPSGRCVPIATTGLPFGVIPPLSDVEHEAQVPACDDAQVCEDAQVLLYAQWEGLLAPTARGTTNANAAPSTRTQHLNDKRRTSQ
jgi:hypothetical protein